MILPCIDCRKNYRAHAGDGGRCRHCAKDQPEPDREATAAMRMPVLVFATNDPDVLAGTPRALHSCKDCGLDFPGPLGGSDFAAHACSFAA